jgi:hypothetical protein
MCWQAKQLQIDDLLVNLNNAGGDLERLREEKDQEIMILQEGMDSTIQQLSETQQVLQLCASRIMGSDILPRTKIFLRKRPMLRSIPSSWTTVRS